jgi:hypothetical protein
MIEQMRSATILFVGLIATAPVSCFASGPPLVGPDTATPPSTVFLQTLKHALDGDQLLQEAFFSDDNLKTFFDATSVQWFIKDDDPPRIGKIAIVRSALAPDADIRVSSLFVPGTGKTDPQAKQVYISIVRGVHLTQNEVIGVFGTPNVWTRRVDPHGDTIPMPLHFGDELGLPRPRWDGTLKKGASFSTARDGTVNGILIFAIGPSGASKPNP